MYKFKTDRFEVRASHNVSTDKLKIRFGNRWFIFYQMKRPDKLTVGISNETKDGMYCFFADYDNIKLSKLKREIKNIMKRFDISSVAILKTKEEVVHGRKVGNYHVISADKMKFDDHKDLLSYLSCDENFKRAPNYYTSKQWVLRIYPKMKGDVVVREAPELVECVTVNPVKRQQSSAILDFLRVYYGASLPNGNSDGLYDLRTVEYATGSS